MTGKSQVAGQARYAPGFRLLHWLTATLVLTTIPAGLVMVQEGIPRTLQDSLFIYHKNVGPMILILVILRLAIRVASPQPPLPESLPRAQVLAATAVHWLLYLCLIVMALSGTLRVQAGGFPMELWDPLIGGIVTKNEPLAETAESIHAWVKFVLIALIAAHVGAAAMHGLIRRDGVFSRMWPPV